MKAQALSVLALCSLLKKSTKDHSYVSGWAISAIRIMLGISKGRDVEKFAFVTLIITPELSCSIPRDGDFADVLGVANAGL